MRRLCELSEIPREGLRFTYRDGPFESEGILLRLAGGNVAAYKNECRHLAMPLDERDPGTLWDPDGKNLACASHGALFRPTDGLCISGPCRGSHLKSLPIEVRDDQVFLDESALGAFFRVEPG